MRLACVSRVSFSATQRGRAGFASFDFRFRANSDARVPHQGSNIKDGKNNKNDGREIVKIQDVDLRGVKREKKIIIDGNCTLEYVDM